MQLQVRVGIAQLRPLALSLLNAILAEQALPGGDDRLNVDGIEGFRDRHQPHRRRIAPDLPRCFLDSPAHLFEPLLRRLRHGLRLDPPNSRPVP